jgi:alpha-amylase/alpha-mannosidase (GH57 family)
MRGTENDTLAEKGYSPFLTNRSLSYHHDTIALANEMNVRHNLDNRLQYEFLLNTVRPKKRYAKWTKKETHSDIAVVKEYFGYSDNKAMQALTVLDDDQLKTIKIKLERGGKDA